MVDRDLAVFYGIETKKIYLDEKMLFQMAFIMNNMNQTIIQRFSYSWK
jgi:hypothetical protein